MDTLLKSLKKFLFKLTDVYKVEKNEKAFTESYAYYMGLNDLKLFQFKLFYERKLINSKYWFTTVVVGIIVATFLRIGEVVSSLVINSLSLYFEGNLSEIAFISSRLLIIILIVISILVICILWIMIRRILQYNSERMIIDKIIKERELNASKGC